MTLALRYMQLDDIPQVVAIDRQSFADPWSARSYTYEVTGSDYSHMLVLGQTVQTPVEGWRRWLGRLNGNGHAIQTHHLILGYGGLWNIMDEAHISTVAAHPDQRGKGYGELLLAAMIRRAATLEAAYIVLEVRVSNIVAQKLYRKYGFEIAGVKEEYYRIDREDAYDMRLDLTNPAIARRIDTLYQAITSRIPVHDSYSSAPAQAKSE